MALIFDILRIGGLTGYNAKSTQCIQPPQTFVASELVSCPTFSCPLVSATAAQLYDVYPKFSVKP